MVNAVVEDCINLLDETGTIAYYGYVSVKKRLVLPLDFEECESKF
jgi:hypothetical protein